MNEVSHLLPAPAKVVDARVHDQSASSQQVEGVVPEEVTRIREQAQLLPQELCVQCPALGKA